MSYLILCGVLLFWLKCKYALHIKRHETITCWIRDQLLHCYSPSLHPLFCWCFNPEKMVLNSTVGDSKGGIPNSGDNYTRIFVIKCSWFIQKYSSCSYCNILKNDYIMCLYKNIYHKFPSQVWQILGEDLSESKFTGIYCEMIHWIWCGNVISQHGTNYLESVAVVVVVVTIVQEEEEQWWRIAGRTGHSILYTRNIEILYISI